MVDRQKIWEDMVIIQDYNSLPQIERLTKSEQVKQKHLTQQSVEKMTKNLVIKRQQIDFKQNNLR